MGTSDRGRQGQEGRDRHRRIQRLGAECLCADPPLYIDKVSRSKVTSVSLRETE